MFADLQPSAAGRQEAQPAPPFSWEAAPFLRSEPSAAQPPSPQGCPHTRAASPGAAGNRREPPGAAAPRLRPAPGPAGRQRPRSGAVRRRPAPSAMPGRAAAVSPRGRGACGRGAPAGKGRGREGRGGRRGPFSPGAALPCPVLSRLAPAAGAAAVTRAGPGRARLRGPRGSSRGLGACSGPRGRAGGAACSAQGGPPGPSAAVCSPGRPLGLRGAARGKVRGGGAAGGVSAVLSGPRPAPAEE